VAVVAVAAVPCSKVTGVVAALPYAAAASAYASVRHSCRRTLGALPTWYHTNQRLNVTGADAVAS